ncbi:MAG TPA: polysaccharide biosynthesis C-terminal domain-containing protein, partial [Anaerolineae bacterium]
FLKLDVLMLSYYRSPVEVGFYAVALALVSRLDVLKNAVLTSSFPDACRQASPQELRGYIRQSLKLTALSSAALVPLFALGQILIELLYGTEYSAAVPVFSLLLVGFIIGLNAAPIAFVLYPLNRPRWIAASDVLQLVFNSSVNLLLIPSSGIIGAALAVVLTRFFAALITFVLVRRFLWTTPAQT